MAARFVLIKVGFVTVRLCTFGAITRGAMCTRANVQHVGYRVIAAVREDAARRFEFHTSRDAKAVLITESSGEHWASLQLRCIRSFRTREVPTCYVGGNEMGKSQVTSDLGPSEAGAGGRRCSSPFSM